MSPRITLNDVAAHAGVSRATASLVVRGTGRLSDATRRRVQATMDDLGYVYNRGAASLRSRRGDTIGVVVTNLANPFLSELFQGLQREFNRAGYTCLVAASDNNPAAQLRAVTELREHRVAGMAIVPASGTRPEFVETLRRWTIEHVFMTRYLRDAQTNYVGPDDVLGGRLAAEHLLEHGCTRFAYVGGGPEPVRSRWDRIDGIRQAIGQASSDAGVIDLPGEASGPGGLAIGRQMLERGEVPDAIVCHSDSVALGVMRALRPLVVSHEVRVVGYDDIASAALWEPPLTSVFTGSTELGELSAQMLLANLESPREEAVVTTTRPTLMVRESCGCPPR